MSRKGEQTDDLAASGWQPHQATPDIGAQAKFNLSEWALRHKSLVTFFMLMFSAAGILAYLELGREEDPDFTIKQMIVAAQWPGASAEQVTQEVTDRIERKLEQLPTLDYTRSITVPGSTLIYVHLLDTTRGDDVQKSWVRVRNLIRDIQPTLPENVRGPIFDDDFGDVYGNIYAFTSDGLSRRQLRDEVERVRRTVIALPQSGKVELLGAQDEVIYLEFSPTKLAAFGIEQAAVVRALREQNAVVSSGAIEAGSDRVRVDVSGALHDETSIAAMNLRLGDRFFRLSDIADVRRGYVDPPSSLFRVNGKPAIGLQIGMRPQGNILEFGKDLGATMKRVESGLPVGIDVQLIADQPKVVEEAVHHFTRALFEAVLIVLAVSFVSLGVRAGLVVALAIPLVLAMTFVVMNMCGITLQRISLGALIIALGLLVDDAMIAVEMMIARLERGDSLAKAAIAVYSSTAFPMLTGTLVTVAGFIPVGLNPSAAGEFTATLFKVMATALLASWVVAVVFTPLIGVAVLPEKVTHKHENGGKLERKFRGLVAWCMHHRWVTIGTTLAAFVLSVGGLQLVQQQFFPSSDRPELVIDWTLPHNASIEETQAQMDQLEHDLLGGDARVEHFSSYVGRGAPRFILSFDVQPPGPYMGQTIILTKGLHERDALRRELAAYLQATFPSTDTYVHMLDIGPPVGRPIQYRVRGPEVLEVRRLAHKVASVMSGNPMVGKPVFNWSEPGRVIKIEIQQEKARALGVSSETIASALNGIVGGQAVTQVLDDIYLVDVVARASARERRSIEALRNLNLPAGNGVAVPLSSIASFHDDVEPALIWRRDRVPTVTVKADVVGNVQAATAVTALAPAMAELQREFPAGYAIDVGGAVEESARGQGPIVAVVPLMVVVMLTILMLQLQSFSRLFLVISVAPLALIGVVAAMLMSGAPVGFVALLGILALVGILIRNSVILVMQIDDHLRDGWHPWDAVIDATQHRMRPILLTAAAASLGLIPIARQIFWGPMAYAMMGGIIVGTLLTLLFLPALYVAWFRVQPPESDVALASARAEQRSSGSVTTSAGGGAPVQAL